MSQFELCLLFAAQEMDLFQEEDIAGATIFVLKLVNAVGFQCLYHFIDKILRSYIVDPEVGVMIEDGMACRMGEVALSQACVREHKK